MPLTRREFLVGAGGGAVATLLAPVVGRTGAAFGAAAVDPSTRQRNRLVVVFLSGGNDGLNYLVPTADVGRTQRYSVYRKVRPSIGYTPASTLALARGGDTDQAMGLNARLPTLHRLYADGRVAFVQGVDYPKHNYSHFASADIWHSGDPEHAATSGWLGRHLDRVGTGEGELRGVAIGTKLPLIMRGRNPSAASVTSIPTTRFSDGDNATALARHHALVRMASDRGGDPLADVAGRVERQTVSIVDELAKATTPPSTGTDVGDALLTARVLLEQNLGVECVYVEHAGFDTHAGERATHEGLLGDLDGAIEAFWLGTVNGAALGNLGPLAPDVAERTMVMFVSEFGRRIGEVGTSAAAGTDHGAAAPVTLIGPPSGTSPRARLVAGLHGDHPAMGTVAAPADNLQMTTDVRQVYQAVLQEWLASPDSLYQRQGALPGLFTDATTVGATSAGRSGAGGRALSAGSSTTADTPQGGAAAPRSSRQHAAMKIQEQAGRRGLHPVSVTAAVIFDAFIAALVIRAGGLRELRDKWRQWRAGAVS